MRLNQCFCHVYMSGFLGTCGCLRVYSDLSIIVFTVKTIYYATDEWFRIWECLWKSVHCFLVHITPLHRFFIVFDLLPNKVVSKRSIEGKRGIQPHISQQPLPRVAGCTFLWPLIVCLLLRSSLGFLFESHFRWLVQMFFLANRFLVFLSSQLIQYNIAINTDTFYESITRWPEAAFALIDSRRGQKPRFDLFCDVLCKASVPRCTCGEWFGLFECGVSIFARSAHVG